MKGEDACQDLRFCFDQEEASEKCGLRVDAFTGKGSTYTYKQ